MCPRAVLGPAVRAGPLSPLLLSSGSATSERGGGALQLLENERAGAWKRRDHVGRTFAIAKLDDGSISHSAVRRLVILLAIMPPLLLVPVVLITAADSNTSSGTVVYSSEQPANTTGCFHGLNSFFV